MAFVAPAPCSYAGNLDCDLERDSADLLILLEAIAGLPAHPADCPDVSDTLEELPGSTFVVDAGLSPLGDPLTGIGGGPPRSVTSMIDAHGNQADYVANELLISTDDQDALDAFLVRWHGQVLDSSHPGLGADLPTIYLVHIDPSAADPQSLPADISALADVRSDLRLSDEGGLNLLAAAAEEAVGGADIALNFVFQTDDFDEGATTEAPFGTAIAVTYTDDAFAWPYMDRGSTQDIGVADAWRALEYAGKLENKVKVAVLDGGFAPNQDFPAGYTNRNGLQIPNPGNCGAPNSCPWHGTHVAVTGFGVPDNNYGAAGPGGPVADLLAVQLPALDLFQVLHWSLTAVAEGNVKIGNISSSTSVPAVGCIFVCGFADVVYEKARAYDALFFASAGNQGMDVDLTDCFIACWEQGAYIPCETEFVVCVGGLNWDSTVANPQSNFGSNPNNDCDPDCDTVDIFAPFVLWSVAEPDAVGHPSANTAQTTGGTSFSSPFAAGIAALIKAADPSLSPDQVAAILRANAHTGGGDPKVPRWLDAYRAVTAALGGDQPFDLQIDSPPEGSSYPRVSASVPLTASVVDPLSRGLVPSWSSSIDGALGSGLYLPQTQLSFGTHVITASVTSGPYTDTETVTVTIINEPPTMTITNPPDGTSFFQGETVNFAGTSFDPNTLPGGALPEGQVSWHLDGAVGSFDTGHTAVLNTTSLSLGLHSILFRGSDGDLAGAVSIGITIVAPPVDLPPSPVITNPPPNFIYYPVLSDVNGYYVDVTLTGSATDPEDITLTGSSLVWTDSVNNGPAQQIGTGASAPVRLYGGLCGNSHHITLTATDSFGNIRSYSVDVTLSVIC